MYQIPSLRLQKKSTLFRLSLDDLKTTLQELKDVVSPNHLLTSVMSWISYDKMSRRKALDYTLGYLQLTECGKQFLRESAKTHIQTFRNNPECNLRVTGILHPRKLSLVVIGGAFRSGTQEE